MATTRKPHSEARLVTAVIAQLAEHETELDSRLPERRDWSYYFIDQQMEQLFAIKSHHRDPKGEVYKALLRKMHRDTPSWRLPLSYEEQRQGKRSWRERTFRNMYEDTRAVVEATGELTHSSIAKYYSPGTEGVNINQKLYALNRHYYDNTQCILCRRGYRLPNCDCLQNKKPYMAVLQRMHRIDPQTGRKIPDRRPAKYTTDVIIDNIDALITSEGRRRIHLPSRAELADVYTPSFVQAMDKIAPRGFWEYFFGFGHRFAKDSQWANARYLEHAGFRPRLSRLG